MTQAFYDAARHRTRVTRSIEISLLSSRPLSSRRAHHYKNKELVSAAIYAAALRRLSPDHKMGEFTRHDMALHQEINSCFGMNPPTYLYQAVDTLLKMLVDKLAEHGIADTG